MGGPGRVWSRGGDEAEKRRTETDGPALPLDVQTVLAVQRAAGNRALVDTLSGGQGEMLLRARGTRGRRPSPDKPYRKAKASSPYAHIPKSPRLAGAAARGINAPASGPGGYHFWRGGRPGWSPSIDEKLNNVTKPEHRRVSHGVREWRCATCRHFFPLKADAGDGSYITLDHIVPWVATLYPFRFTDQRGHLWEAYFQRDVAAAYNDESNLRPMCNVDNATRGGPDTLDKSGTPVHVRAQCPACSAPPEEAPTEDMEMAWTDREPEEEEEESESGDGEET